MSNPNPQVPPEQIAAAIEQVQTEQQINKPGAFPLEVSIPGTPQKFTGSTPQEVLDKLVHAQAEATRTIAEERTKRSELETQFQTLQGQIERQKPQTTDDPQQEIQEHFNLWAKNPTEATKLQLAKILGVPPERVADVMKDAIGTSVVNKAADEFTMRCPDFPQTQQNAVLMRDALAARYGTTPDAATADNLEIVYHQLVREGKIQPASVPVQALANGITPIPHLRGNSAPPNPVNDLLAQARTMPIEQLKEVINRLSTQGVR